MGRQSHKAIERILNIGSMNETEAYGFLKSEKSASSPKQENLNDTDKMPFGQHRGTLMQDVPASYFHWLWTNGMKDDKHRPVADYIRRNLEALKKEHPDGIWT